MTKKSVNYSGRWIFFCLDQRPIGSALIECKFCLLGLPVLNGSTAQSHTYNHRAQMLRKSFWVLTSTYDHSAALFPLSEPAPPIPVHHPVLVIFWNLNWDGCSAAVGLLYSCLYYKFYTTCRILLSEDSLLAGNSLFFNHLQSEFKTSSY